MDEVTLPRYSDRARQLVQQHAELFASARPAAGPLPTLLPPPRRRRQRAGVRQLTLPLRPTIAR